MTYKHAAPFQGKKVKLTWRLSRADEKLGIRAEMDGFLRILQVSPQGWLSAEQTIHRRGEEPWTGNPKKIELAKILALEEI
jgi:hypothetical protein